VSDVIALARPEIRALQPYSHAAWEPGLVRLHANENPWRDDADRTAAGLNRYPEPQPAELVGRIAALYGVASQQVLVGRGSDEGIDLLVRAFCAAGRDRILVCPPTFGMYRVAASIQGAGVTEVPLDRERGFALDAEGVAAAWTPGLKIAFLCSPNNPTGNLLDQRSVARVLEALAGRALVVVDEAYAEFAPHSSLVPWLARYPHLVILRTLSKAYGLAGARLGAVLAAPEIVELLRRMIPPYALTVPTIEAGLSALSPAGLERCRARVDTLIEERGRLATALATMPLVEKVWPSDANFLLVECADAGRMLAAGIRGGLLVRDVRRQPGLERCLRITVGTPAENARLIASLEAA
jgi:histidinol-phosphate aminotransferase